MGFWHTGYIEFHEPVGLGDWHPPEPSYACPLCANTFSTPEALRDHRFHAHPFRRPLLFLGEREVGTQTIRIAKPLVPGDIRVEYCDRALLNGTDVPLARLPAVLTGTSSDLVRLTLEGRGVSTTFSLDIRIASDGDLDGVDDQVRRTAIGRRLDTRAIDEFIVAASRFTSAIGYCDGICAYLYGVLAKERSGGVTLPYEAYTGKFTKASEALAAYERPLARTIRALIAFHFNHFDDALQLASAGSRLANAASRYSRWLRAGPSATHALPSFVQAAGTVEALVTDWDTEQLLRFASRDLAELAVEGSDLEAFLARELAEFDRVKARVLLGQAYAASGAIDRAEQHAKALWNVPTFERWAQGIITLAGPHEST